MGCCWEGNASGVGWKEMLGELPSVFLLRGRFVGRISISAYTTSYIFLGADFVFRIRATAQ